MANGPQHKPMRIQFMSDLHLEFKDNAALLSQLPLQATGDVLVLAGDIIYIGNRELERSPFLSWAADHYEQVLLVAGNHEFYGGHDMAAGGGSWEYKLASNVGYFHNRVVRLGDVDFILTTLWSHIPHDQERLVNTYLNDFHKISFDGHQLTTADYNAEHARCLNFLRHAVASSKARHRVVVSHHVPTLLCSPPKLRTIKDGRLLSAFTVDLTDYISQAPVDVWIYGHSHSNFGVNLGGTRVLSNQLGYVFRGENKWNSFEFGKMVDV